MKVNTSRKLRRKLRVSTGISGTADKPRISVYRSNRNIFVQAIDDVNRRTLAAAGSKKNNGAATKASKSIQAANAGKELAAKLKELKINYGIFDRGAYTYNGRIKVLADAMREEGIKI